MEIIEHSRADKKGEMLCALEVAEVCVDTCFCFRAPVMGLRIVCFAYNGLFYSCS